MAGDKNSPGKKGGDDNPIDISPKKKMEHADWDALKHEWVTTNISLMEMADKYGLPHYAVRNHYNRDGWKDALHEYNGMVKEAYENVLAEKAKCLAERVATLDETVVSVSEKMIGLIESKMIDLEHEAELNADEVKTVVATIKSASDALKNCHYNVRLANDQATSIMEGRGFESRMDDEERARLEREFAILKRDEGTIKKEVAEQIRQQNESNQTESISDGESSEVVVSPKSPSDTQQ